MDSRATVTDATFERQSCRGQLARARTLSEETVHKVSHSECGRDRPGNAHKPIVKGVVKEEVALAMIGLKSIEAHPGASGVILFVQSRLGSPVSMRSVGGLSLIHI